MITSYKSLLALGFILLLCSSIPLSTSTTTSHGQLELLIEESSTCTTVYKDGSAPAVFESPECSNWNLSKIEPIRKQTGENCQLHRLQGRRKYQEDRLFCELDLHIPFPAKTGIKDVTVGMVGVFDGHNGAEASEMASKLLLDYLLLHVHFLRHEIYSDALKSSMGDLLHKAEEDSIFELHSTSENYREYGLNLQRFKWNLHEIFDGEFHLQILKESLLRAIHDIDANFSQEAHRNNIGAGSTAIVTLIVDNKILVSNVGDSKAILCSETFQTPQDIKEAKMKFYRQRRTNGNGDSVKRFLTGSKHFSVKELSRDHHPDRDDEKSRIESSGGFVTERSGVARVNGQLAVSRSIGDVPFKRYGVISAPEVTDWAPLSVNDTYFVAASDGVFEKMTTKDVCDVLWEEQHGGNSLCDGGRSLAECVVKVAFETGSMDNLAAIVVPLHSNSVPILD